LGRWFLFLEKHIVSYLYNIRYLKIIF